MSDLICAVSRIWTPASPIRTAERKLLIVPLHEAVDKPQMQPVLAKAAEQLANSGLLFKWQCYEGTEKLCH